MDFNNNIYYYMLLNFSCRKFPVILSLIPI